MKDDIVFRGNYANGKSFSNRFNAGRRLVNGKIGSLLLRRFAGPRRRRGNKRFRSRKDSIFCLRQKHIMSRVVDGTRVIDSMLPATKTGI